MIESIQAYRQTLTLLCFTMWKAAEALDENLEFWSMFFFGVEVYGGVKLSDPDDLPLWTKLHLTASGKDFGLMRRRAFYDRYLRMVQTKAQG